MEHQSAKFEVEVALLPAALSGKASALVGGYRPNHKHPLTGEYFMGQFSTEDTIEPGQQAVVCVTVLASTEQIAQLQAFGSWTIWEGPRHVGSVRLLRCL